MKEFDLSFYKNKRVFITGHTGFKGSWLCKLLSNAGAIVFGYALEPPTHPALYDIAQIQKDVQHGGDRQKDQRHHGIAHRPQERREIIVQEGGGDAAEDDDQILPHQAPHLRRHPEKAP